MDVDDRIQALENELKLIKGEIKETLISMQDFLQSIDLPPPPDDDLFPSGNKGAGAGMAGVAPSMGKGGGSAEIPRSMPATPITEVSKEGGSMALLMDSDKEEGEESAGELADNGTGQEEDNALNPASQKKESEQPGSDSKEKEEDGMKKGASQVNMLSNMIRWVAAAKKQVGDEQLPVLLDVYGMTGYMSAELKQVILHLAEVIKEPVGEDASSLWRQMMKEQISRFLDVYGVNGQMPPEFKSSILHLVDAMAQRPPETNPADVWSRLILELHGILAADGVSFDSLKPFWTAQANDEEKVQAEEEEEEQPIKLRFAVPLRGGEEREFSISLSPEAGDDNKPSTGKHKK
jgi:hypothetical protein